MTFDSHKHVSEFCELLSSEGIHCVKCHGDETTYFCGPHALSAYREQCEGRVIRLFSDDELPEFQCAPDAKQILSIGRAGSHDQARRLAHETRRAYATCPLPLTNDCFATDRGGGSLSHEALAMGFPRAIILDWDLCAQAGLEANKFGLGEVIGLAASVRDYVSCSSLENRVSLDIVSSMDGVVERLLDCWCSPEREIEEKIANLGACLSLKGMLIQLMGTNLVVAGCDHLVAYELESRGFNRPHGSLVAAGTLLTLPLCPGVSRESVEKLADMVLASALLTCEDLQTLSHIGIRDILRCAPKTRPNRQTLLHNFTQDEEIRGGVSIKEGVNRNE